ncbi:MAG: hypothetical protein FJY54_11825 [Betaproteobacteria bacterium]|nr:hypothetical protein [Betaproteobacteria bacterium]
MLLFRRIALSALLVGTLAGLLLSVVQRWQVIPIIEAAERYEQARAPAAAEPPREVTAAQQDKGHAHGAEAWEPADGLERIGLTVLSNVLLAIGFAFVIVAAMATLLWRNSMTGRNSATKLDWRYGLLWGLAGYGVFFVAPAIGLAPAIPGTESAPVEARQLWWTFTVICTAAGLAVAAFGKAPWRWAGLLLLVAPYLVGAPHLDTDPFPGFPANVVAELNELSRQFIWATAIANGVFWLVLGGLAGWATHRNVEKTLLD